MTSRERVQAALRHQEPDRLPIDFGGTFLTSATTRMQRRIAELLGLPGEPDTALTGFDERIQKHFGCDLRSLTPTRGPNWGIDWAHLEFSRLRDATIDDLDHYAWPEPDDGMVAGAEERAKALHASGYFVCASQIGQGIFEATCYLRGYEQALLDSACDEAFVHAINQKVLSTNQRLGDLWFGAVGSYADMVLIGDDLATQTGPYMSLDAFRRLYKPYFAEYIASIRRHCPDAIIAHHCCGSSYQFLDDLAEIGVQVINPVQTSAADMAPEKLATKKDRLSFLGGVDLQRILPFGERQEVEDFVRNLISTLGRGGGLILAACHSLPDDVKPENVITMLESALRWGSYRDPA